LYPEYRSSARCSGTSLPLVCSRSSRRLSYRAEAPDGPAAGLVCVDALRARRATAYTISELLRHHSAIPIQNTRRQTRHFSLEAAKSVPRRTLFVRRRVSRVVTPPCRPWSLVHGLAARPDPGATIAPGRGSLLPRPLPARQESARPFRLWQSAGLPRCR